MSDSTFERLAYAVDSIWSDLPQAVSDWPSFSARAQELLDAGRSGRLPAQNAAARLRELFASEPKAYDLLLDAEARLYACERQVSTAPTGAAEAPPTMARPPAGLEIWRRLRHALRTTRRRGERPHGGAEPPPAPPPRPEAPPVEPARYANTALLRSEDFSLLGRSQPVVRSTGYIVRFDIGELSSESVVANAAENPVPVELLPRTQEGHWLELAVTSPQFETPDTVYPLFLPNGGPSFVCGCAPHGPHGCTPDERDEYVLVPVRAPDEPGTAHLRIALYYRNNVVQTQLLTADVVEHESNAGSHAAAVDFTLTADLRDLGGLEERTLSIVTNETAGTHTILVNGGAGGTFSFHFAEGQLDGAMDSVRTILQDVHIEQIGNSRKNRLDKNNGKPVKGFVRDLSALAQTGWLYWTGLFVQAHDPLRTALGGSGETIQVARVQNSVFVFPWGAIYDLPLDDDPAAHVLCPLVQGWDGSSPLVGGGADRCPHESSHGRNILCPFGFWGFRHAIEQPGSTGGRELVRAIQTGGSLDLAVARSLDLDAGRSTDHLKRLRTALPAVTVSDYASLADVEQALADPELELLYFYCHGRRKGGPAGGPIPCLEVGHAEEISPAQIITWYTGDWLALDGHWATTSPLVFINGCHTTELTPQTPVNFVDHFMAARAAGVVGTEITLEQSMAGEAAQVFLAHFAGEKRLPAAESLRRMRLHFLGKGNLLGLAYTAYCPADLHLVG